MRTKHLCIVLATVAVIASGCSSTRPGGHNYPPAELVTENPAPVRVAPTRDGKGVEVGFDMFNLFQNPLRYTRGEWATIGGGAIAAWAVSEGHHQSLIDAVRGKDTKSKPGASGTFAVNSDGASGEFENLTGSLTATLEKAEPMPDGEGEKTTRVTLTLDQYDED